MIWATRYAIDEVTDERTVERTQRSSEEPKDVHNCVCGFVMVNTLLAYPLGMMCHRNDLRRCFARMLGVHLLR